MAYSEESAAKFDAPVYLGGMFAGDDSSSDDEGASNGMVSRKENRLDASAGRQIDAAGMRFEVTNQTFPNMVSARAERARCVSRSVSHLATANRVCLSPACSSAVCRRCASGNSTIIIETQTCE